jgi:hypothetical protein
VPGRRPAGRRQRWIDGRRHAGHERSAGAVHLIPLPRGRGQSVLCRRVRTRRDCGAGTVAR